jgi:hypothetical protein
MPRRVCRHPDFEADDLALLGALFARGERAGIERLASDGATSRGAGAPAASPPAARHDRRSRNVTCPERGSAARTTGRQADRME